MFDFLFGKKPVLENLDRFDCVSARSLADFRQDETLRSATIDDVQLEWYDSGQDKPPVVLLPGTTGKADVWFLYYMALKQDYRVFVPSLPRTGHVEACCEVLGKWLEGQGISPFVLVGQSFGGALAQSFSDKYPDRVSKLVLITSFSNTSLVADKTRKNYDRSLKRFTKALKDIKFESLQKSIFKQVVTGVDVAFVEDKPFWKAFYGNMLLESDKELLKSMHDIQIDFWKNKQADKALYPGETVLVEAKTDGSYDREEKKALLQRYAAAKTIHVEGSSNLSHIREMEAILKAITS